MRHTTKIAIVVRADLATWQQLNVTAFLASGIAATVEGSTGADYADADGHRYLPMFGQPVLIYTSDADGLRAICRKALDRELTIGVYTGDLFATSNDEDNRAAVRAVTADQLDLVGLAVHGGRNSVDKALKGLELHP
ncbi:MAG TPA: DUF2000 domain-containing protein [Pseudonocardiaceae bacterium]|nr:DUF2000 domain-containing protein [Pseudonocardiaceae bacterium]